MYVQVCEGSREACSVRVILQTRGGGGLNKINNIIVVATKTNGRIIRTTLSNWLLPILFGKLTDIQSRKAWSLSCSNNDNDNLGVSCKKQQFECSTKRTWKESSKLIYRGEKTSHLFYTQWLNALMVLVQILSYHKHHKLSLQAKGSQNLTVQVAFFQTVKGTRYSGRNVTSNLFDQVGNTSGSGVVEIPK